MAVFSAMASLGGAAMQASAAKKSAQMQMDMYETTRSDLEPYRDVGEATAPWLVDTFMGADGEGGAIPGVGTSGQLGAARITDPNNPFSVDALSEGFQTSPGYDFQMKQGLEALDNSASARGNLLSGGNIKAREEYAQGVANQDYWNFVGQQRQGLTQDYAQRSDAWNRGFNLAGMGQNAAAQTGQAGQAAATQAGAAIQQGGAAWAQGIQGAGKAIGSAFSSAMSPTTAPMAAPGFSF